MIAATQTAPAMVQLEEGLTPEEAALPPTIRAEELDLNRLFAKVLLIAVKQAFKAGSAPHKRAAAEQFLLSSWAMEMAEYIGQGRGLHMKRQEILARRPGNGKVKRPLVLRTEEGQDD